ncbi:MAG: alanine racemase [Anaerolineaceae bacterium]|jgi:alanine racemase
MDVSACSTWVEVDLGAIHQNVSLLKQITGVTVMAVVKANAYGHGIVETARAALADGAGWCGVARIEEALVLRQAGIQAPILVTGYTSEQRLAEAMDFDVSLTVYAPEQAEIFSKVAQSLKTRLKVHAKIDISMGRLGVFPEEGLQFVRRLNQLPRLAVEGVFTHFASADEPKNPVTDRAIDRFQGLIDELGAEGLRPPLVHAANSATALYYPRARFDLVRCGISIYGLHPSSEALLPAGFRAALAWKARLTSIKTLPPGYGVGYNARYVTIHHESIGTISVGYADGFRRRLGNFALVRGQRVPVVGGVCMDQCMLQLDQVPEARMGDEVVLIGRQGDSSITAEEVADAWGTVNYEVVCGLAARIPRFYLGQ